MMKRLVILLLLLPLVYAQEANLEGARTSDILAFCQETKQQCFEDVEAFAKQTDDQVNARFVQLEERFNRQFALFKFTLTFSVFLAVLAAFLVSQALALRRDRRREEFKRQLALKTNIPVPKKEFFEQKRPAVKTIFFLIGLTVGALIIVTIAFGVGFFG